MDCRDNGIGKDTEGLRPDANEGVKREDTQGDPKNSSPLIPKKRDQSKGGSRAYEAHNHLKHLAIIT